MGTTVFRIGIELIFRRCWNLITPSRSRRGSPPNVGCAACLRPWTRWREPTPEVTATPEIPAIAAPGPGGGRKREVEGCKWHKECDDNSFEGARQRDGYTFCPDYCRKWAC